MSDLSHLDRLEWLTSELKRRASSLRVGDGLPEEHVQAFLLALGWLRLAASYASATAVLLRANEAEATAPILRAVYELDADVRYLLEADLERRAARAIAHAAMSKMRTLNAVGAPPTELLPLQSMVDNVRRSFPADMDELEKQRPKHWGAASRTALLEKLHGKDERNVYAILSWSTHPEAIEAVRSFRWTGSGTFTLGPREDLDPEEIAWHVGGLVYYLWNRFASVFGLEALPAAP